ncbi:hypothetical protein CIPAW_13G151000 [Carya illinoinensis]|uniref:Uncharacterized protein n=1 Tax=Carya illinoinensis TaxID=32201 RepID=A0A8T1NUB6_CARIL|nr:hypothetical protein CIPAW_13G151000 [Carya illinoinensis]
MVVSENSNISRLCRTKRKPMSRHRRQASLVLPPEIISGEEIARPSDMGQAAAGVLTGHGATGASCATVGTESSKDRHKASKDESVTHCPATTK